LDDEWVSMCQPRVATPIDAVAMPTAGASIASGAGRTRGASAVANVFATSGFVPSGFAPSGFHAGGR
jgi:hypothetical protein